MDMGSQAAGRKRLPNRERLTAEDDALNQIAREAEARLAAKRAARAEAREIRMKELERQQKEIYQVQKKYYGLDAKWGDIEQWMVGLDRIQLEDTYMEDSERYSRRSRRNTSASDEDERMSVGSRGSLRTNGYDAELYGSQPLTRRSGRNSSYSGDGRSCSLSSSREEKLQPSEHSAGGHRNSSSRASSRASSARASPVVEERPEKDFAEKGSRSLPGLSAATLASLGGTSSRRGSGDTSISIDTEASMREIKELSELKDQIQDVEGKYMQGLKEMKDSLAEVEEKYKKAMVSNAQLDNEKTHYMYQVDTLKDTLLELEEQLAECQRLYAEKSHECEREKHAHSVLQLQFAEARAALTQREQMLEEIRQLQQKQASYIREISDLQETIEWKDKKIGALERQKEFFDSIRSERDDLREEVVKLKEEIKKHGIILNSEVATNGETSDTLNNVGYQGSTKMTKEELNVLKATGDGALGRASEVEVEKEIVENVGNRELLQNTERKQHKEDGVDTEVLRAGENAEDRAASEDTAPSLGTLANAPNEEQVQSHMLDSASFLERTEQVGSQEAVSTSGGRTGAPCEQSQSWGESDRGSPGPSVGQGTWNALDTKNQSEKSAEEQGKQALKSHSGEVSTEAPRDSAPLPISEVEGVSSAGTGAPRGSPTPGVAQAGPVGLGEQVGTAASSPLSCSSDTVRRGEECVVGAPEELGPSTGRGPEKEPAPQTVAEPREAPGVGGENDEEEDGGSEVGAEKPAQTGAPTIPSSPAATEDTVDAPPESLDTKAPSEDKTDPPGEASDSPQKKTKNKKKKNRKKRSPAPVDPVEAEKELAFQSPDLSEVREEAQVELMDDKSGAQAHNEAAENPKQTPVARSSENMDDCPENPKAELEGTPNSDGDVDTEAGRVIADGDPLYLEGARDRGCDDSVRNDSAGEDGAALSRPPEPGWEDASGGALCRSQGPCGDLEDASQPGGTEGHEMSGCSSDRVRKVSGGLSLESDDVAPAGELGDFNSGTKEAIGGRNEKDKSKEDCTLS